MSKPEWGIKRTCQSCDSSFYDLKKDPIICPKCLTIYDENALIHKQSVFTSTREYLDENNLDEDSKDADDDFFLDAPSDLLESLEDLDEEFHPQQSLSL